MNEINTLEDQDNENIVVISGNLENFFDSKDKHKKIIHKDEIYDLASLPQSSDKKLLDEDGASSQKDTENHTPRSLSDNNKLMKENYFPEQISENIRNRNNRLYLHSFLVL